MKIAMKWNSIQILKQVKNHLKNKNYQNYIKFKKNKKLLVQLSRIIKNKGYLNKENLLNL